MSILRHGFKDRQTPRFPSPLLPCHSPRLPSHTWDVKARQRLLKTWQSAVWLTSKHQALRGQEHFRLAARLVTVYCCATDSAIIWLALPVMFVNKWGNYPILCVFFHYTAPDASIMSERWVNSAGLSAQQKDHWLSNLSSPHSVDKDFYYAAN